MATLRQCFRRIATGMLGMSAVLAAGCTDRPTPSAVDPGGSPSPTGPAGTPSNLIAITGTADVEAGTLKCGDPTLPPGVSGELIVGGQGQFVVIRPGTATLIGGAFTVPVAVENRIPQPLGTANGVTLDPGGVRVFLDAPPIVTRGSGTITPNVDGTSTFTAADQGYWQYNQVLAPGQTSSGKSWSFAMPSTVQGFTFTVYVAAVVPFPDGWVQISPSPLVMQPFREFRLEARVVNVLGMRVGGDPSISFSSPDTTVATITGSGVVSTLRAGTIQMVATSGSLTGTATVQVLGMTRVWRGTVSTAWTTGENWVGGIVPVSVDSVLIPNPAEGPNYPLLSSNRQVAGVTVESGATISLSAFDLTATGSVATGLSGGIDGTVGRVVLAGTAQTVHGVLPRVRVPGTYTLTGNLTTRAPLRVESGRLRNASFRIRTLSF